MKDWLKTVIVGISVLNDAYDLFVISLVMVLIRTDITNHTPTTAPAVDPSEAPTTSTDEIVSDTVLAVTVIAGAMIGQLVFGLTADRLGRRKMFLVTLTTIVIFGFLSAFSFPISGKIWISLSIFRFFLGIGIGGEYPLSATIAAEGSDPESRGRRMAFVFSMQGVGNFLAPTVILILLYIFPIDSVSYVWRLGLGFGVVPCLLTAYHRFNLHESGHFENKSDRDSGIRQMLPIIKRHKWTLLGTAGSWFLFDITFYGNGLFSGTVLQFLGLNADDQGISVHNRLVQTAQGTLVLASLALPGYYLSIPVVDFVGRKPLQFYGFASMAITFLLMGIFFDTLQQVGPLFVIIYGLTFFFSNFGPNTTTYIVSGEVFPTEIRATCHGISAAAGKLGALVGVIGFKPLQAQVGLKAIFFICAIVAALGFLCTCLVPEKKGSKLEAHDEDNSDISSIKFLKINR